MKLVIALTALALSVGAPLSAHAQPAEKPAKGAGVHPGPKQDQPKGKVAGGLKGGKKIDMKAARKARLEERAGKMQERADELRKKGREDLAKKFEAKAKKLRENAENPMRAAEHNRDTMKRTRKIRKRSRIKRLNRKFGDKLQDPSVQEELQRHGERSARLRRMKTLAKEKENDELTKRINILIMKEHRLHTRRMSKLTGVDDRPKVKRSPGPKPNMPKPSNKPAKPAPEEK